jgi:hypothetical protein
MEILIGYSGVVMAVIGWLQHKAHDPCFRGVPAAAYATFAGFFRSAGPGGGALAGCAGTNCIELGTLEMLADLEFLRSKEEVQQMTILLA